MKISLFGKNIFDFKKSNSKVLLINSGDSLNQSKFLPDFHTMRENGSGSLWIQDTPNSVMSESSYLASKQQEKKNSQELKKKFQLTPKKVFELKFLNKKNFKINTDSSYVETQIQQFKDKLDLVKLTEFDMSRGVNEIASIIVRLENRKKYNEFESFFNPFAYTTTERINQVIKNHSHLQLGKIEQFIADMPKEAIDTMKSYTEYTEKLCSKKAVYYIIADKKDFKKTDQRRDPILLAQSPFGHVWQILGAWDDEMMFLQEL